MTVPQLNYQEGIWLLVSNGGNKHSFSTEQAFCEHMVEGKHGAHVFVSPFIEWSQKGHFMPTKPVGSALAHITPSLTVP